MLVSGYYLTAEELQTFNVFRENCNKDVTQLTAEGQTQFLGLARLAKVNNLKRKSLLYVFSFFNCKYINVLAHIHISTASSEEKQRSSSFQQIQ